MLKLRWFVLVSYISWVGDFQYWYKLASKVDNIHWFFITQPLLLSDSHLLFTYHILMSF